MNRLSHIPCSWNLNSAGPSIEGTGNHTCGLSRSHSVLLIKTQRMSVGEILPHRPFAVLEGTISRVCRWGGGVGHLFLSVTSAYTRRVQIPLSCLLVRASEMRSRLSTFPKDLVDEFRWKLRQRNTGAHNSWESRMCHAHKISNNRNRVLRLPFSCHHLFARWPAQV